MWSVIFLIEAHSLADFWFQNDRMCCAKSKKAFGSPAPGGHITLVFGLPW
ncbi:DUF3307 domain-containing protein [Odoribacter sp. N15.MGS-14]